MEELKLQLLYGIEFWDRLEYLISNAKERVFIVSAYIGKQTYEKYIKLIPQNVYSITLCRSDSSYKPSNAFYINEKYFHGKIYLIDDTVIIGSQNLYDGEKEGEFSTLIETDSFNAGLILYQALLKVIEKDDIKAEPIDESFIELYQNGCPFCGNDLTTDLVHTCLYGSGFVSDDDCDSYGGEDLCKSCHQENRLPIDAICCDDSSGCGLGIFSKDYALINHAINPISSDKLVLVKEYLRLFNYFRKLDIDAVAFFNKLGFNGKVYKTTHSRKEHYLINYEIIEPFLEKDES